jgi:transcriptional regulator with XRE-family HTH domain
MNPSSVFADRLSVALRRKQLTQGQLAVLVGVDRSTISQFLSPTADRLPRAETLVALAHELGTSIDWLLGLSSADPATLRTDLVEENLAFEPEGSEPVDERLVGWLSEARGLKVRYVPATLPDLLKTDAVIRYETESLSQVGPTVRIENAAIRLAWQRTPEADVECVSTIQGLEAFARGEDIYRTLPLNKRREQLERMVTLVDELYPTFRWYLVDRRRRFPAPITIFGTRRAALYVGQMYVVFNTPEQVTALAQHFDTHLRAASVEPRQLSTRLKKLIIAAR